MNMVLRPVCWRKGHAPLVEQYVEALPLPFLVCSRCGKLADDAAQTRFYRAAIGRIAAGAPEA